MQFCWICQVALSILFLFLFIFFTLLSPLPKNISKSRGQKETCSENVTSADLSSKDCWTLVRSVRMLKKDNKMNRREESSEMSVWQHVCVLFGRHFVVPWTYRSLRTSVRKIKISFGSVLHYWSYSLYPSQAGYSAAPRCGYTLHSSPYSVKPTEWLQKASV